MLQDVIEGFNGEGEHVTGSDRKTLGLIAYG